MSCIFPRCRRRPTCRRIRRRPGTSTPGARTRSPWASCGARPIAVAVRQHGLVYGNAAALDAPFTEASLLAPAGEYAVTKAAADLLLGSLVRQGLRSIRYRLFNHTGAGDSERFVVPRSRRRSRASKPGCSRRGLKSATWSGAGHAGCARRRRGLHPGDRTVRGAPARRDHEHFQWSSVQDWRNTGPIAPNKRRKGRDFDCKWLGGRCIGRHSCWRSPACRAPAGMEAGTGLVRDAEVSARLLARTDQERARGVGLAKRGFSQAAARMPVPAR